MIALAAFGMVYYLTAAGGNYGSRKVIGGCVIGVLLLIILPWLRSVLYSERKPGRTVLLRRGIGGVIWAATPPLLFIVTQAGVYSQKAVHMKLRYVVYGLIMGYLVLGILTCLCKRADAAGIIFILAALLLLLIDYYVTEFRGTPFSLMDLTGAGTALNVMGSYRLTLSVRMAVLVNFGLWLAECTWYFQTLHLMSGKRGILVRVGAGAGLCLLMFLFIQKCAYTQKYTTGMQFNQARNYAKHGYWFIMAVETSYLKVEEPEGYSPEKVLEKTRTLLEEMDHASGTDRTVDGSGAPENIIVIMNESLADLEGIGDTGTREEILPFLHSLSENTVKGKCYVHVYGGGTADSEYEMLTGSSKEFLPLDVVAYTTYTHDPEYGLASTLKQYGYRTAALHPMTASNWNREKTYKKMQFDRFYSSSDWPWETQRIRDYVSDRSLYESVCDLCSEKEPGEKLFAFCVTMQNHGGYAQDTWSNGFEPEIQLSFNKEYPKAKAYLTLARESDRAFEWLIRQFEDSSERTMIVMFGDHLPKLETGYYRKVFGGVISKLTAEETMERYQTPYVIWTNYERESGQMDISANYLGSLILKEAGLPGSAYNRLGLEIMQTLPVIGPGYVYDAQGNFYSMEELPEEYRSVLEDYRYFQYNLVFDRKHLIPEAFEAYK